MLVKALSLSILLVLVVSGEVMMGVDPAVLSYLQQESAAVTSAQHAIQQFLLSKKIPVGLSPVAAKALRKSRKLAAAGVEPYRVAVSTEDNDITCRIALAKVPAGRKCIAPCGCSGSQEWVQFSELNRLRRLEPSQWTVCQTCRRPFDYGCVQMYGGVPGNLISLLLDNLPTVRATAGVVLAVLYYVLNANSLLMRFLTSKFLWQLYPKWSRVLHLPLVLKLWFGKIALDYASAGYLAVEKILKSHLTEIESSLVEPNLPVTASDSDNSDE